MPKWLVWVLVASTRVLLLVSIRNNRDRAAALDHCLTQTERALDVSNACDQALEWCLGELRAERAGGLRQNLSGG